MNEESLKKRGRKHGFSQLARFWRREGRRYCAIALCASLIAGNIGYMAVAASDEPDYKFELNRTSLYEALQKAVSEGDTVDQSFEFQGNDADIYDELLEADGNLYELKPEIEDNDGALKLRVFARLDGEIPLDSAYEINGSEEMLFLLCNTSKKEQKAVVIVDDRITEQIRVAPKSEVELDGEANPYNSTNDLIVGPTADMDTALVTAGVVTQGSGSGGNSGGGGSSSGSSAIIEIMPDQSETETDIAVETEVRVETEAEVSESEDATGEPEKNVQEEYVGSFETDEQDENVETSETVENEELGETEAENVDLENSIDDQTGRSEQDINSDDADERNDNKDTAVSGDAETSNADSDMDDTEVSDVDTNDTDTSDVDTEDINDAEDLIAAVSVHTVCRVATMASPSNALKAETATASNATDSNATSSNVDKEILDGIIYRTVLMGNAAVSAYVVTAEELGFLDMDTDEAIVEYSEFSPEPYVASNGVIVTLYAEEGVLPAGTTAVIREVTEQVEEAVRETVNEDEEESSEKITKVLAYDITLYDAEGNKLDDSWSDNGTVRVTFSGDIIAENSKKADTVDVMHVKTDADVNTGVIRSGEIESIDKVCDTLEVPDDECIDEVKFDAEHFSLYLLTFSSNTTGTETTDDPVDVSTIKVSKTFAGLDNLDEISDLTDFAITVDGTKLDGEQLNATLKLNDDEVSVVNNTDGSRTYTWTLENVGAGSYTVSETGEKHSYYDVTSTYNGDLQNQVVTIKPANLEFDNYKKKTSCKSDSEDESGNQLFEVGIINLVVAKLTQSEGYFIWTDKIASATTRLAIIGLINQKDGFSPEAKIENCYFYSGVNIADENGLQFKGGTVNYFKQKGILSFSATGQWSQFMVADYSYVGSSADINIVNTYKHKLADVTITKEVSGNMGDVNKEFTFKVTLTDKDGKVTDAVKVFRDDSGNATNEKSFQLKHNGSITLRLPIGAKITIAENADGYEAAYEINEVKVSSNVANSILSGENLKVNFTNVKNGDVDTGILLDSMPYVLILGAVAAGIAFYFIRKKKDDEDDLE